MTVGVIDNQCGWGNLCINSSNADHVTDDRRRNCEMSPIYQCHLKGIIGGKPYIVWQQSGVGFLDEM
jgi:hypothetical protein